MDGSLTRKYWWKTTTRASVQSPTFVGMDITSASFVISNTDVNKCPAPTLPEYAFIGRSNVGKSSLINMLTGRKGLAKTSGKPGKTRLINHFLVNEELYLVDSPGYGYASVSKTDRQAWKKFIYQYLETRANLMCTFVLVDSRIPPQKIDLEFMEWMGENGLPFVIVFTKTDKLTKNEWQKNQAAYRKALLETWEELPPIFGSSSEKRVGKEEILAFVAETNELVNGN